MDWLLAAALASAFLAAVIFAKVTVIPAMAKIIRRTPHSSP